MQNQTTATVKRNNFKIVLNITIVGSILWTFATLVTSGISPVKIVKIIHCILVQVFHIDYVWNIFYMEFFLWHRLIDSTVQQHDIVLYLSQDPVALVDILSDPFVLCYTHYFFSQNNFSQQQDNCLVDLHARIVGKRYCTGLWLSEYSIHYATDSCWYKDLIVTAASITHFV